jgi:glycosyltransferase involved in cell wall biosynthesis
MTPAPSLIAFFLPTLDVGGVERVTFNLVTELVVRGHRVDLVTADGRGAARVLAPEGVNLVDLRRSRAAEAVVPLARYLRRARPRALISAKDHANVLAVAAGALSCSRVPVVVTVHTRPSETLGAPERWTGHLVRVAIPQAYRHAAGVVAVSDGVARDVRAIAPHADVHTILNPVIADGFGEAARATPAPHPWLSDDRTAPVVVWCGRMTEAKDPRSALLAVLRVHEQTGARLLFVGDGPQRADIEREAQAHGAADYVEVVGYIDEPAPFIARADALLFTSTGREGLPTVLIESLALSTPVVATDCEAGPRQILGDGRYGRLVAVRDVDAMATALVELVARRPAPMPDEAIAPYRIATATDHYLTLLGQLATR